MSTLKTNTIQHLTSGFNNVVAHTDGAGTTNAVHARAWVNFNGAAATITPNASFNVSSITDNGNGVYAVNFTNAMSDANYCVATSAQWASLHCTQSITTTSFGIVVGYFTNFSASASSGDTTSVTAVVFR